MGNPKPIQRTPDYPKTPEGPVAPPKENPKAPSQDKKIPQGEHPTPTPVKLSGFRGRNKKPALHHLPKAPTKPPISKENLLAKRNADAFTAFKVTGAVSTLLFLGAGAGAVYGGVKYLKFMGIEKAMDMADSSADTFFDEAGNLTDDSRQMANSFPDLMPLLKKVEARAKKEDKTVHEAIEDVSEGVSEEKAKWKKVTVGTGIAAGAGLLGMIIFLTAASITKHRGNMLYRRDRRQRMQAQITPEASPEKVGVQLRGRF